MEDEYPSGILLDIIDAVVGGDEEFVKDLLQEKNQKVNVNFKFNDKVFRTVFFFSLISSLLKEERKESFFADLLFFFKFCEVWTDPSSQSRCQRF